MPKGYPANPEKTRKLRSEAQKNRWAKMTPEEKREAKSYQYGKRLDGTPADGRYVDKHGYVYLTQSTHPLAHEKGHIVAEHRAVLYDTIGPAPHLCHWGCGKLLEWQAPMYEGIYVDHLDGDVANNDPTNLVPSCFGHNRSGARNHKGDR